MLDYIFFHISPYQSFISFLQERDIAFKEANEYQESTEEEGLMIAIEQDLDDATLEKIENYYDQMMDLTGQLVSEQDDDEVANAGIAVNLKDGRMVMAQLDPSLVYKISTLLSQDELMAIVNAVVDAVENPDDRPLCKVGS